MEPTPSIIQTPIPVTEDQLKESMVPDAGVPHDAVVTSPAGEKEKIVYDTDENGTVVGWHKEKEGTV